MRGSSTQGARDAQSTGGRRAGRHGVGAQGRAAGRTGRAAGRTVRAGHGRPRRCLGAGRVRRLGQLGQFWCTVHLAQSSSVFGPGSTRYFPESPNEHCSLKNKFFF